ncbi:MAG: hypothetical protein HC837_20375 [Chloroflexaceae bacterium]|nr:hypothetical protein [Chloroflexaceae bacterium]
MRDFLQYAEYPYPDSETLVQQCLDQYDTFWVKRPRHPNDEQIALLQQSLSHKRANRARARITLEIPLEVFMTGTFLHVLASILNLSSTEIEIEDEIDEDSVQIMVNLPAEAAKRLEAYYQRGDAALQQLPLLSLEVEYPRSEEALALLVTQVLHRCSDSMHLERLGLHTTGTLLTDLWALISTLLQQYDDPLLPPAQRPDTDDPTQRWALRMQLETALAAQPDVADQLTAALPAAVLQAIDAERPAIMLAQLARMSSAALEQPADRLTPALQAAIQRGDHRQPPSPSGRWFRLGRDWLTVDGDAVWHVRLAHVALTALLSLTETAQQDLLAHPETHALRQQLMQQAAQWRVPQAQQAALVDALLAAMPWVAEGNAIGMHTATLIAMQPRILRQHDDLQLRRFGQGIRGFGLSLPLRPMPTVAVLGEYDTLFDDTLHEIAGEPEVYVSRQPQQDGPATLVVGIQDQAADMRWQVQLVDQGTVIGVALTDAQGLARFTDVPG